MKAAIRTSLSFLAVYGLSLLTAQTCLAGSVHLAVASNFSAPIKQLATEFEITSGHTVTLSFGSSGKFYAQIQHGAPFEIFLSADQAKPAALEEQGMVVPASRFTYAIGTLVLWSSQPDLVDQSSNVLSQQNFNKLAMANPRVAPYGVAAVQVLEALNLRQATESKWVQGENIAQTFQFVSSGNADLGFVALSQVIGIKTGAQAAGSAWIVPSEYHQPIRQDAVLLPNAEGNDAAKAFMDFLQGPTARTIIEAYGYKTS
ncbi:MAG: molybdate transport system substrate-binding protein [Candidatus Azotimanducaceae bacterium]|jgi:molybdate transport system substrate-binding protein